MDENFLATWWRSRLDLTSTTHHKERNRILWGFEAVTSQATAYKHLPSTRDLISFRLFVAVPWQLEHELPVDALWNDPTVNTVSNTLNTILYLRLPQNLYITVTR